ncbi:hypothetical protein Cni_G13513 [Canna indica]|uniref:Uncharacterized protein n=1 Tax=Canna indica TaxID=4628 RepID=A0AAQ3Q9W8_9LILI|nr:hypothetical protein Cni_G13513 [Canna indica]
MRMCHTILSESNINQKTRVLTSLALLTAPTASDSGDSSVLFSFVWILEVPIYFRYLFLDKKLNPAIYGCTRYLQGVSLSSQQVTLQMSQLPKKRLTPEKDNQPNSKEMQA